MRQRRDDVLRQAMPIKTVIFDLGETLICEDRMWAGWANYLGVSATEFRRALDDVIARGEHHRRTFERFRPHFDFEAARRERLGRGENYILSTADLYPDARACLQALRGNGYRIGIAGNQPIEAERAIADMALDVDFIASSAGLNVEKPAPQFFAKVATLAGTAPEQIAYVGDRIDNDVLPARNAGMIAVFLERGPWGRIHAKRDDVRFADIRIKALLEIPAALATFSREQ
jgi:HAD superfamily hydrolase (TIGR01549 family)